MPRRLSCIISVLIQTTIFGHNKKNVVDANNIIISIINSRSRSFATLQCSTATKDSPTKAPDWLFYYSDYPTIIGRPANKVSRMGIFPLPQNQHNKTYNTHLHLFCWLPKTTQISMIAFVCVCGNKNRYFSVSLPLAVALHTIKNKRVKEWRARLLLLRFGWSLGLNRTYLIQLLMVFPINIINISYIYTNTKLARRIFVSLSICCVYLCYHVSLFFSWLWDWEGLLLEVVKISARDCR